MFRNNRQIAAMFTVIAIAVFLATASLRAEETTVLNHSFENPTLGDGGLDFSFPSWARVGPGAIANPTISQFPGEAPDGSNVVFLGGAGAIIEQGLSAALSYGTYQLDVEFGQRMDVPFAGYSMNLLAGGSILVDEFSNLPTPGAGEFLTATRRFSVTPESANSIVLGSPLSIRFLVLGNSSQETAIDNVRLSFVAAVPEPGSGMSLMMFLLSTAIIRPRR